MKEFIRKYEDRIHSVLSCFDRMLFRGYLPIMSGWAMAEFLYRLNVNFGNLKAFLLQNSERVKNHAIAMAKKQGRPFRYLAFQHRQRPMAFALPNTIMRFYGSRIWFERRSSPIDSRI